MGWAVHAPSLENLFYENPHTVESSHK